MKKKVSAAPAAAWVDLVWGLVAGLAVTFAAMLACAFVLTKKDMPEQVAVPLGTACIAVGAAAAGFVTAVRRRSHGMAVGAIAGLCLFVIVLVASVIAGGFNLTSVTPIRLLLSVALSAVTGVAGVNIAAKRKMI